MFANYFPRALEVPSVCHMGVIYIVENFSLLKSFIILIPSYISELNKNPVEGFSAGLVDDDDIYQWEVVVIGPQDTLL